MKFIKTASGKRQLKMSKGEWINIGKKTGWKKASFEWAWEAKNYLMSISRMIEDIKGMDKVKVREAELKTGLLEKAFILITKFEEEVR
jgi:hypothetical protein